MLIQWTAIRGGTQISAFTTYGVPETAGAACAACGDQAILNLMQGFGKVQGETCGSRGAPQTT